LFDGFGGPRGRGRGYSGSVTSVMRSASSALLGDPRGPTPGDRDLDRTHLPPPTPTGRPRTP